MPDQSFHVAVDRSPDADSDVQSVSSRHLWMVGVWDCTTNYHPIPGLTQWTSRRTSAVYTLKAAGIGGVVHGEYHEPGDDAVNFDDTWVIGSVPINTRGDVNALYTATTSDGTLVEASGTMRLSNDKGVLGADDFVGTVQLADGSIRDWIGGEIAVPRPPTARFIRDWNVEIAPGVFQLYADSDCTSRLLEH